MAITDGRDKDMARRPSRTKGETLAIRYTGPKDRIEVHGAHTDGSGYAFIRGQVTKVPKAEWSIRLARQPGFKLEEDPNG